MSAFGPKVEADGAPALPCWIGGHAYLAMAPVFFDVVAADGRTLRRVPLCGEAPVAAAIESAAAGLAAWCSLPPARREAGFVELHSLLERYRGHLAGLIAEEAGLSHELAESELREALAAASGIVAAPTAGRGVAVVIGDQLSPLAGVVTCTVAALAAGWAVVLKPAPAAPSALLAFAELCSRAGFPDGLVNLVHGDEAAIYALCASEAVSAVACVGSDELATRVREIVGESGQPFAGGPPNDEMLAAWRRCLGVDG